CSFKKLKGQRTMIRLYHGNFLEKAKNIPDDSVDLVLTDPPYGTVKGMQLKRQKEGVYGWDEAIEPKVLFAEINRILRKNGKAVLFGQEPFTSRMITEAIPNLPFSYRMIWEKDNFANGLGSKKAPVNYYEDVMVFSKTHNTNNEHPLKEYALKINNFIDYNRQKVRSKLGHSGAEQFLEASPENSQFTLCTKKTYGELIRLFEINKMEGFISYEKLKRIDKDYKKYFVSVFNIWEKEPVKKYEDVLVYSKEHGSKNTNPISLIMKDYQEKANVFWNDEAIINGLVDSGIASNLNSARTMAHHKLSWKYRQQQFST